MERTPKFPSPPPDIVADFKALRDTLRTESSVYNDFELESAKARENIISERTAQFPRKDSYDIREYFSDADERSLTNDILNDKYLPLRPYDTDSPSSPTHKPFSSVYLLVRDRNTQTWGFPTETVETNLESAGISALKAYEDNANVRVRSKIPVSVYVNKYSKKARETLNLEGEKVFFMKAQFRSGNLSGEDFKWCTKDELGGFIEKDKMKRILPCLT